LGASIRWNPHDTWPGQTFHVQFAEFGFEYSIMKGNRRRTSRSPGRLTQEEVAALFGISKMRVSQLEQQALSKLARSPILRQFAKDLGLIR
jgi:hypothetical protein